MTTVAFDPITLRDLVAYAGATGEYNPVHYDPEAARAAGLDGVLVHGTLAAGLIGTALAKRWGELSELSLRFVAPLWCDEAPVLEVSEPEPGALEFVLRVPERLVLRGTARLEEGA